MASFPSTTLRRFGRLPDGTLWVGAYDGVARYDGTSWQVWTEASSRLSDGNIFDILVDHQGNAWIATGDDGVNVLQIRRRQTPMMI